MKNNQLDVEGLVSYQFSLSTGEDELNYFYGQNNFEKSIRSTDKVLSDGIYRIIDDELCQIIPGAPTI